MGYNARIGPNCAPGDSLRYWVHWLATDQNRCLEMSPTYLHSRVVKGLTTWAKDRRQSEWDDHGEVYSMLMNGPHVYCSLDIPPGLFYLSLYDDNKDGHDSRNRFRDYYVSVKSHPGRTSLDESGPGWTRIRSFYDLQEFDQKEEWAHARIKDFWGGVYKRFLVRGPTKLTFQVNRNHSFNTVLAGVMLDLVDELPPPYHQTREEWAQRQRVRERNWPALAVAWQTNAVNFKPVAASEAAARKIFADLQQLRDLNAPWWAANKRRFYQSLLRWCLANEAIWPEPKTELFAMAGTCAHELQLFPQWEECLRAQGKTTAREVERSLRWDGVTWSYAGKGNEVVRAYLAEQTAKTNPPDAIGPVR